MLRFFIITFIFLSCTITNSALAEMASVEFSVIIQEYLSIQSPNQVLIANVTNDNGVLDQPLNTRFRVITNTSKTKTLYLKATTITEDGIYNSMFNRGGLVYLAFSNINNKPKLRDLNNCIYGGDGKNVVAYPIINISGAKYKYMHNKYEVYIDNGVTDLYVTVGVTPLYNSFSKRDDKGFYQTTLHLTEVDI